MTQTMLILATTMHTMAQPPIIPGPPPGKRGRRYRFTEIRERMDDLTGMPRDATEPSAHESDLLRHQRVGTIERASLPRTIRARGRFPEELWLR